MVHYRDTKGRDEAKANLIPLINTHIYIYVYIWCFLHIHFGTECSDFLGCHKKKTHCLIGTFWFNIKIPWPLTLVGPSSLKSR